MKSKKTPASIYYFASTHWDREWYLPFQGFRSRLVEILDNILKTLEKDGSFTQFILDGQTVFLEDYLEIQDQNRSRVSDLLTAQRMVAGPWYTMPDENLVSGESLIRNLLTGHEITASLMEKPSVLPLGYLCDCFGHIAQMPQILNGFHISNALVGRGTNQDTCPSFFLWESPDGSRCATYKVPESCGYGTFFLDVFASPVPEDADAKEELLKRAIAYVEKESQRSPLPFTLLMDGMDHTPIHPEAPWILAGLCRHFSCDGFIGQIGDLFEQVWNAHKSQPDLLPVFYGELQETARAMEEHNRLIPGTLSSRYDLKLQNDTVQTLLEKVSLPLAAMSALSGHVIPPKYADTAYRYLLKNHAHDSICGCSLDEVHQDMHYRFRQAGQIGREISDIAMKHLLPLERGNESSDGSGTLKLTLYHPLPFVSTREVEADLWMPADYPCRFDEMIPSEQVNQFRLIDASGADIPYQIRQIQNNTTVRAPRDFYGEKKDLYRIVFTASLPAMGYAEYKLVPSEKPVRFMSSLRTGDYIAENEYLILEIKPDGNIRLTEKRSRRVYEDLLHYKDSGETGDGWTHRPTVSDRTILSTCASSVECTEDGPCVCTFCITHVLPTPAETVYHRQFTARSTQQKPLIIKTFVTLSRNATSLSCTTEVLNQCRDHRLVLSLKTGIPSSTYTAEQAFALIERPAGQKKETHDWKEPDFAGKSFAHIVYRKRPDNSGFAFLSGGGLHECAALAQEDGQLDICLFRSFEKTFLTDGQPDGQLTGTLSFHYMLHPFEADTTPQDLLCARDMLQVPVLSYTTPVDRSYRPVISRDGFSLAKQYAYLSLIEPAPSEENSVLVRLVNYSDTAICDTLTCPLPLTAAFQTDLLRAPQAPAAFENNTLSVNLNPYQIQTYLLRF